MKESSGLEGKIVGWIGVISIACLFGILQWMSLGLGGIEFLILSVILVLIVEGFITVSVSLTKTPFISVWVGLIFHIIGFVCTLATALCEGVWMKPYEYVVEHGHSIFSYEASPAYLWWVLIALIAFRLIILQPIYLYIWHMHMHKKGL